MQLYVVFLGTGGSWPTIRRNVTSIAIKRGAEVILFDCGEGTQRQIQKSSLSYMQISRIFISHFHGDHFLGLPGLIQTMQLNDRKEPLYIYGPKGMGRIVSTVTTLGYFKPSYPVYAMELHDGDVVKCNGYNIQAIKVNHTIPTLAYAFEENKRPGRFNKARALELGVPEGPLFSKLQRGESVRLRDGRTIEPSMVLGSPRPGRKIVFSGDTRPCNALVKLAKDADLLIHDATFLSDLEETAYEYGHSTARQAAEIASSAGVNQLALVHISPRYTNGKNIEKEAKEVFEKSFLPSDFYEIEIRLKK